MDSHLIQKLILALAVLLVVGLSILAVRSVFRDGSTPPTTEPDQQQIDPAPAAPPVDRSGPVVFRDGDTSFSALCQQSPTDELSYSIVITNLGNRSSDFAVEVWLSDSSGSSVSGVANVAGLDPSEQREISVASEQPIVPPATCTITAVETDRQVVRIN